MSQSAPYGDICPNCLSLPCRCSGYQAPTPAPAPYIDPFVLIRIAMALERIADNLDGGAPREPR